MTNRLTDGWADKADCKVTQHLSINHYDRTTKEERNLQTTGGHEQVCAELTLLPKTIGGNVGDRGDTTTSACTSGSGGGSLQGK